MRTEPSIESVLSGVVDILDARPIRLQQFVQLRFGFAPDAQSYIVPCRPKSTKEMNRDYRLSSPLR
jgi:hypothetical protein